MGHKETTGLSAGRFALRMIAVTLLIFVVVEWAYGWLVLGWSHNTGDLTIYTDATRRLLSGGSWYLGRQAGSYELLFGDVLYPPVASLFFAPWLVLPGWTFVAIPALIVGWSVRRATAGQWILIALCLLWPATGIKVLSANPSVWIAAFVALGLRYRWPAALVLLKPSVFPLALIGVRSRGWWITVLGLALLSLPFLNETLRYPAVVFGARGGGLLYNLVDLPVMLIPLLGRDVEVIRDHAARVRRRAVEHDAERQLVHGDAV